MSAVSSHGLRTICIIILLLLVDVTIFSQEMTENETSTDETTDDDLSLPLVGWSPSNPFIDEEAPPALFNLDRGDADVDLYLLGSWNVSSTWATGIAFHPPLPGSGDRVTYPYVYPGFETNLFDQTVDLTLSLWLYERYFFEASFADDSDLNTIAAGYYGGDDELVREFVFGNVPLAVQPYPYQYAGTPEAQTGKQPTPGTVLRLQTAQTYHEFLLQLENSVVRRERYANGASVEEARIRPEKYERDRLFVLPDRSIRDVVVYAEDADGTTLTASGSRRFRIVEPEEGAYVVDTERGILRLGDDLADVPAVAVYYESAAGPVGAAGGGVDAIVPLDGDLTPTNESLLPFSFAIADLYPSVNGTPAADRSGADYQIEFADGRDALVLREPGIFSPFAAASLYAAPEGAQSVLDEESTRIRVVRAGSRVPVEENYTIDTIAAEGVFRLETDNDETSRDWRYPFAARDFANAAMYGPRASPEITSGDVELLVEYRVDAGDIALDGDVVPGTLIVTVDGVPLDGVEIDYGSGELTLPPNLDPNATVDVTYRVYQVGEDAGDLVFINGNRWSVSDSILLTLATGVRWTLADDGYSEELDEHPGVVTVSAGLEYSGENLTVDSALAVQISQPDTTGFMRLFSAGETTFTLTPGATNLFPAPVPDDGASGSGLTTSVDLATRETPLYRNYWSVDGLGNIALRSYNETPESEGTFSGDRIGPYIARSNDADYTGATAILEWDALDPDEWVGGVVRVAEDAVDLRDAVSITFYHRYFPADSADPQGDPELLIQLGTFTEDLDGDGVLDEGDSAVDPGVQFDLADGGFRRAGQYAPGLTAAHSEDGNGDDILGTEQSGAIWSTVVSTADIESSGWRTQTIELDRSDAELLGAVRGARFILLNGATTETIDTGRLLIGGFEITRGGRAAVVETGGGTARAAIVDDPLSGSQALASRFDVVGDRFLADDEEPEVLRLTWSSATGDVAAESVVPDISLDRYRRIVTYAYLSDPTSPPSGADIEFRLSSSRSSVARALSWTVDADELDGEWHEIAVDLDSGDISVDGRTVATTDTPSDQTALLRLFTITVSGIDDGTLYVDELHAADPRATAAFAGRVTLEWGVEIGPGRLALTQEVAAQSQGFRSAETGSTGSESDTAINRSLYTLTRAEYGAGEFRILGESSARATGLGETGAFAHELDLPLVPGSVILEERFRRDYDYLDPFIDRRFALAIGTEAIGAYRVETGNRIDALETEQSWGLTAAPPLPEPISLSLSAELLARDLDSTVENDDYGADWAASWVRFTDVVDDGRAERRGNAGLEIGVYSLAIGLDGGWRNESDTTGLQANSIGWDSEIPIEFSQPGRRPWTFTPAYSRDYSVSERRESHTFTRDLEIWAASIGDEPVVVTAIPVAELFQEESALDLEAPSGAIERRAYGAEGRLTLSRVFGSRLRDLFVPSDIEFLLGRERSWENASLDDERSWQATISAVAINLFGIEGSTPRSERFLSDEYRSSLVLELDEQVGAEPLGHRVAIENETRLFGFNEAELGITNTYEQSRAAVSGDRGAETSHELEFVWFRPGYPKLAVFERMETAPFYRHTETLGFTTAFEEGELDRSELLIGHETALIVGENGSIRVFGDIGWLLEPGRYENGTLQAIGLQLGIQGELRY